jgi:hypothetical protein
VISEPGNADDALARPYEVKQQYRERVFYYNSDRYWLKPDTAITLLSGDLFKEKNGGWHVFSPVTGVAESRILVIAGADTMRIDLPDDMRPLIERAWARWDTCINEYQAGAATHQFILKRLQEEANWVSPPRNEPPPGIRPPELLPLPPTPVPEPPRPQTPEEWEGYWAGQPPLREVKVDRTSADTVWVRISGRVMLDGGCASGMPLFGIEMLTDTGWAERIPFELTQMDCGMPWGDWEDRVVMVHPLRWWVGVHQPEGKKTMSPGSYRLFFVGGDLKRLRTEAFRVDRS